MTNNGINNKSHAFPPRMMAPQLRGHSFCIFIVNILIMSLYQDSFNRKRRQGSASRSFISTQFTPVTGITRPPTLPAPELTATTISDSQINLSWTAVTGARNYSLWFNVIPNYGSATLIYTGPNTSFNHTGLSENQTYYYYVMALGRGTNSGLGLAQTTTTDINFLLINEVVEPGDIFLINSIDKLII